MPEKPSSWIVDERETGDRLDLHLLRRFPVQSRSQIQRWIRSGRVRINDQIPKTGYSLRTCDQVWLSPPSEPDSQPRPEAIPLRVLYEDSDLAVIDKPAGMACHPGAGTYSGTLVNALLHHLGPIHAGDSERPGIVHRLDKLTSGVLVVAKTNLIHRALAAQFKERTVKKVYQALVYGKPQPAQGTIAVAIGRDPHDRKRISVRARKKREAITHYEVERSYTGFSLLRVRIETGRTHQIRVHLSHKGHPVVGDKVYGGSRVSTIRDPTVRAAVANLTRFFLHAGSLEFLHPSTGTRMQFAAPLPKELDQFLEHLEPRPVSGEN